MKRLVLMRHAQADDQVSGQQDWERPLTRRGLADAETMAKRLKTQKCRLDLLLVSPALRTRQTAEAFSKLFPQLRCEFIEDLYLASAKQLLVTLRKQPDTATHVLVIGHNPGISELANELSSERSIDAMPTAAQVTMHLKIDHWSDIHAAVGIDVVFDYPQNAR